MIDHDLPIGNGDLHRYVALPEGKFLGKPVAFKEQINWK